MGINIPELRACMGRAGVSRQQLADRAGIHYTTLGRIINGSPLEMATYGKIVKGLNEALDAAGQPTIQAADLIADDEKEFA